MMMLTDDWVMHLERVSAVVVEGTHEFYFVDLISHERENLHSQLLHLSFDVLFIIDCTLSMLSF